MELIPNTRPSARLLSSAAVEARTVEAESASSKHRLKRVGGLAGNGRAIFIGLLLGALAVTAAGYLGISDQSVEHQLASVRRFFAVRTRSVSVEKVRSDQAARLKVQIDPSILRVTAIALGHPRLAIINGKEVSEGDSLTLSNPDGSLSVTLRIMNIVEGRIELTDGTQILTAPLVTTTRLPTAQ